MTQICQWAPTDSMCERSHIVVGAKVCELTDGFLWFVCGNFDVSPKSYHSRRNYERTNWPYSLHLLMVLTHHLHDSRHDL